MAQASEAPESGRKSTARLDLRSARGLALFGLALVPLGQAQLGFGVLGTILATIAVVIGIQRGDGPTVRVASMTLLLAAIGLLGVPFGIWIVVAVLWLASRWVPVLEPNAGWLPRGQSTSLTWLLAGMTAAAAGIGLVLWTRWTDEFGQSTLETVATARRLPFGTLVFAVVLFVIVNAVTEEVAYRGIAFEAAAIFPPIAAVTAQAVAFGTLHVAGFPAGTVGVGLAFGYGLMLGILRHLTGGLRLPVVAHMAADATIALVVMATLV